MKTEEPSPCLQMKPKEPSLWPGPVSSKGNVMTKKQKTSLMRIIITAVVFFPLLIAEHMGMMDSFPWWAVLIIFIIPYALIGYDVVKRAIVNISHGQVFDENFLMMVATLGAFAVSEYSEAVAVMLFAVERVCLLLGLGCSPQTEEKKK